MIQIDHLSKKYEETTALNDLTLKIKNGEIFGLLGHNGAGKTTLIKMLVSALEPSSGNIYVNGLSLKEHREEIKRMIGYVSDSPDQFLKLKVIDYWSFLASIFEIEEKIALERIENLAEIFELEDFYQTVEECSHGMRQKVFVIGALLTNPDIWILDEPMTGLDPQASFSLKQMMKEHSRKGNTVLFSTHNLAIAEELCDRICILKKGKLLFLGTMDELKEKYPDKDLEWIYLEMISKFE